MKIVTGFLIATAIAAETALAAPRLAPPPPPAETGVVLSGSAVYEARSRTGSRTKRAGRPGARTTERTRP
ncbi:hypothetical protein [Chthonobacter rhizosphaerae]|uniref:hypothetical protein n=1 Tax=Chthonobacter rhizosphaerae TaxID=2735553 RepID=UPI0015EFCE85|nr:hypothetical protein [Chthonobacter rhizosphaerae]